MSLKVIAIIMIVAAVILTALAIWLIVRWLKNSGKAQFNGVLWHHPENGYFRELVLLNPLPGQIPFWFRYKFLDFHSKPFYFWKEEKVTDKKTGLVSYERQIWEPEPDMSITPQTCYEATEWTCAKQYFALTPGWMNTLKIGSMVTVVIVLVVGLFLIANS